MIDEGTRATVAFLHEVGQLKHEARQGWWMAGVRHPESVAEHSFRTAVIAYVLAVLEGANPDRAAALALFHDVPETRLGDQPSKARPYLQVANPNLVVEDQVRGLPAAPARAVRDAVAEFEARETLEARLAKEADKLECLLQAREYEAQGFNDAVAWIESMVLAMRSESGSRLATAARDLPPDEWWRQIVESYGMPAQPVNGVD